MFNHIQRNFLFVWVLVLLGIALVLSLTFTGCSVKTPELPVEGKASGVLNEGTGSAEETAVVANCEDSDNGLNKEVKGTVRVEGMRRMDKCFGPFLVEYYCEEGEIANQNFRCECSEGKCV